MQYFSPVGGLNKEVLLLEKSAVDTNVFLKLLNIFIWNYIFHTKLKDEKMQESLHAI